MQFATYADVVLHVGSAGRLEHLSNGDTEDSHPNTDAAITKASALIEEPLRRHYSDVDSITSVNAPEIIRLQTVILTLYFLTIGDDVQPETIKTASDRAFGWLMDLKDGKVEIVGLTRKEGAVDGATAASLTNSARGRIFDRDNPNSPYNVVNRRI
jgi:hypothetical protein